MEIRPATAEDSGRIKTVAHDSIRSSYSLSPQQIDTILANEFDAETLSRRIESPDVTVLVAEDEAGDQRAVQGFLTVGTAGDPQVRWLHVDPDARGQGIATALIERATETVEGSTPLGARVLEDAVEGGEFLEQFGFEKDGSDSLDVGAEEFDVVVFTQGEGTETANEPSVPVPETVDADGEARPLDRDERIPGRDAPFFALYSGPDRAEQYGYFCSECGSTDVAADGLDRLECGECGNKHLADEWDGSYL